MSWREVPPAPGEVRPYAFPTVTRHRLSNGLTVLHAHQGQVPVVGLRFVVAAGAAAEPVDRAGLARLTASALDAGTQLRDGPALALELERIGIELGTSAGWDAVDLEATVPSSRLGPALALIAEIARRAAFAPSEVERIRGEQLGQILLRRTEPRALADDAALRFLFAPDTRYARPLVGTRSAVEALDADALRGFRDRLFVPSNCALVIVGDLDADTALAGAEKHFGDWDGSGHEPAEPVVRPYAETSAVHIVRRPDAVQSEIRVGHTSVARGHPANVPLEVMNAILGGMFTSRLNLNLREQHGFTYGVRSGFTFRRTGGAFLTSTAVATDVTARAVEEVIAEITRMHESGVTEDELTTARDYLTGVMPLELQTAGEVADALTELFVYGLPDDWHARHRAEIAAVSSEAIAEAAHRHLRPDAAAIVVVGDPDAITDGLVALEAGDVHTHEAE